MKKLLPYCTILCGIVMFASLLSAGQSNTGNNPINTGLTADSGYITLQNLRTTLVIPSEDTLFKKSEFWKPTDTIGKYYKMTNRNYIVSVAAIDKYNFEANVICEAKPDGTIIKHDYYGVGMYRCTCGWENMYDGFKKLENYYIYTTCGTGPAYCGTDIYIFKEIDPQTRQDAIIQSIWQWTGRKDEYRDLTSHIEVDGDTIILHYASELYIQPENGKQKSKSKKYLDMKYTLQNGKWTPADQKKLDDFLYL